MHAGHARSSSPPPHCAPDGTLFIPSLCPRQLDKNVFKRADDTQERKRIELVAFFSNPRGAGAELHLMREIQELFDAAQWGYEGATAAVHASAPARRPCPPLPCPQLHYPRLLSPSLAPELKGILLNACGTEPMARLIQKDLPSLAIVCWRSIVEDKAAKAFSRGFYAAIAEGAPGAVSVHRAFDAGRAAFLRAGFSEGDPATYLHDRMHEHVRFRRFVPTCHGCKPPVHGQPVLVAKPRL